MKKIKILNAILAGVMGLGTSFGGLAYQALAQDEDPSYSTQDMDELRDGRDVISKAAAKAQTAVGQALAVAESAAFSGTPKGRAIAQSLAKAESLVGDAIAISSSGALTKGKALAVAQSFSKASTFLGNALSIARSVAASEGGVAVATSIAVAVSVMGDATAVATSVASSIP